MKSCNDRYLGTCSTISQLCPPSPVADVDKHGKHCAREPDSFPSGTAFQITLSVSTSLHFILQLSSVHAPACVHCQLRMSIVLRANLQWHWTTNEKPYYNLLELIMIYELQHMNSMLTQYLYWQHCSRTCSTMSSNKLVLPIYGFPKHLQNVVLLVLEQMLAVNEYYTVA